MVRITERRKLVDVEGGRKGGKACRKGRRLLRELTYTSVDGRVWSKSWNWQIGNYFYIHNE